MTRQERIEEEAMKYHQYPTVLGFIYGAVWADRHPQNPWISVKELLPETNVSVLTKGAYRFLICSLSALGEWQTGATNVDKERLNISHWMPIPKIEEE